MKIRNLDTFYWVATLGSYRAASEKLHLTQPAITARIQVLEQDLGVDVFLHDTRRAELTGAGRKLLPYAERSMDLEQAVIAAFSSTTTAEQTVRLGASESIVGSWLPDFLADFSKTRPSLNFDLMVDSSNNLRNAIVAREIDLGFLMGPISEASIENLDLCGYDMIFAAPPDMMDMHKIWTLRELAQQQILTFSANTRPYRKIRELLSPYSDGELKVTSSASLGAIVRLGIAGYGICVLPRAIISDELERRHLIELQTDFSLPPIFFTASYVSGMAQTALMKEIAERAKSFVYPQTIKNIYQKQKIISN